MPQTAVSGYVGGIGDLGIELDSRKIRNGRIKIVVNIISGLAGHFYHLAQLMRHKSRGARQIKRLRTYWRLAVRNDSGDERYGLKEKSDRQKGDYRSLATQSFSYIFFTLYSHPKP
ncbi:hypothetical protein K2E95_17710 [Pseudomonas sp. ERGC3:01]|nr:hypothetical protein [Pseudomonas sp. ERGC3:01]